jgi:hypothetical protein
VLVAGQTDKTQNGIYSVATLGSGSNGSWVRSKDANANDRLTAGMNTFVEEGTYTGQFWHLLTPGPITLGVTELIFGQITGNAAGISSQVQYNLNGSIAGAANLRYDAATGNVVIGGGTTSNSNVTGALVVRGGVGVSGNINVGANVSADKFYTTNGLFWAANGLAFSSGLEVSEINTANTVLSNISTQVTSIRFDRDTGFSVTELNPGNVKVSLGSSFKTWHVPGQADLVAAAEDEVTFFGNGIDITTNPTFPKAITFISNNSILEANIGAFYTYANANIGTLFLGNASTNANLGAFQTFSNANAASQQTDIDNINSNVGAYQLYANANIGTLFLGNAATQANIGAFYNYANANIGSIYNQLNTLDANVGAFEIYANANIGTLYLGNISTQANLGAFQLYANANIGTLFLGNAATQANIGAFYSYANANIGTLYLGNISTQANLGAYQTWANSAIDGSITEITSLSEATTANAATQSLAIGALSANINAFQSYANTKIGTNNNSNLVVTSTVDAISSITGALVVKGGVGIGGNLYVAGNIYAANLTAISISTLSVTDPLLYLTASNPFPYNYDIGFFSHYSLVPGTEENTGLARDYTTGIWGFFSNTTNEPGATVDWTDANLIYDTVRAGELIASNTTISTSTTTGALRVAGGAGIAGALYINNTGDVSANIGTLYLGNIELTSNLGAFQAYANANIGTLYLGNIELNSNLGAFQTYANANVGSIYNNLNTLDANVGAFETYANIYLRTAATFTVTNAGAGAYVINGESNPALYLIRGQRYNFSLDASGHPFWIKTAASTGTGDQYNTGVTNNGDDVGLITFDVPLTAPDVLYYICQFHSGMVGQLRIVNFAAIDANIGTLFLGNASTQANLGAFQSYANSTFGTSTYSNANVTAYLPIHTGNIGAGNIVVISNVSANKFYTTDGIYWTGNGAAYAAGGGGSSFTYTASTTPPVGPVVGDQWYDTAEGILYEYIDDGDTNQWVDLITPTFSSADLTSFGTDVEFRSNITVNGNTYVGNGIYWAGNGVAFASTTYSNANVTAYLTTATGNIAAGNIFTDNYRFANGVNILSTITTGSTYSNTNVTAFLTLGANIGSGTTTANLVAAATTTSTSTTTGALVVRGGAGIAGNAYISGNVILGASTTSNVVIAATTTTTNTTTGALVVQGGAGVAGVVVVGGNIVAAATTASTNTTTGALVVRGGAGIAGVTTVGGNLVAAATTSSSDATTGALVVAGGVGIAGRLSVADRIFVDGGLSSTNVSTGALVVAGGAGIGGNVYANALRTLTGVYWAGNNAVYGSQFDFTSSSTAPSSPTVGDFWYYTTDQILFQYINDGTTSYWVDVQTAPLSANIAQEIFVGNTTISGNMTISGNTTIETSIVENVHTVVDAPGVSITPNNGTMQLWTLGASRTPTTTFSNGQSMTLMITAGAYSITWSTMGVSWITGVAPVLSTSTITVVEFWKAGGTLFGGLVGTI